MYTLWNLCLLFCSYKVTCIVYQKSLSFWICCCQSWLKFTFVKPKNTMSLRVVRLSVCHCGLVRLCVDVVCVLCLFSRFSIGKLGLIFVQLRKKFGKLSYCFVKYRTLATLVRSMEMRKLIEESSIERSACDTLLHPWSLNSFKSFNLMREKLWY